MPAENNLSKTKQSPYILSANGELFHRFNGIGYYDGSHDSTSDPKDIWLPNETQEVYSLLTGNSPKSIFLEGGAGSGKSAILYGLRTILRQERIPYFYIDGHYEKSPQKVIIETIQKAMRDKCVIFYDSADYLIGETRKIRGLPIDIHISRSKTILTALGEAIDSGINVVMTSHDERWIEDLGDEKIIPDWCALRNKMYRHSVRGVFADSDKLSEFYQKSGLSEAESDYLASLINNPHFINHLLRKKGDKKYLDWLNRIFFSYSMAKILVADKFQENQRLLTLLKEDLRDETRLNRLPIWDEFIDFVFRKDYRLLFHSKVV